MTRLSCPHWLGCPDWQPVLAEITAARPYLAAVCAGLAVAGLDVTAAEMSSRVTSAGRA
jgi:hypothetical protein